MVSSGTFSLPSEWDNDMQLRNEEYSTTSSDDSSKVFEQWQTEDQDWDLDMMDLDESVESHVLGDDMFVEAEAPLAPLEDLSYVGFGSDALDRFSSDLLNESADAITPLPFQQRYERSLRKLAESMERSRETRKSLVMKTKHTEHYARKPHVSGVVKSIETSSRQLRDYLKHADNL